MSTPFTRRALIANGLGLGIAAGAAFPGAASGSADPAACAGPLAQDYNVIHHNLDRQLYVEGCGLVRLGPLTGAATSGWCSIHAIASAPHDTPKVQVTAARWSIEWCSA